MSRQPIDKGPMVVLTGAPGVGKSTVGEALVGLAPGCVVMDGDLTGHPTFASDMRKLTAWFRQWLRTGAATAGDESILVLPLFVRPCELESLPERMMLSEIVYVALVCDGAELASRLRGREKSAGISDDEVASLVELNQEMSKIAASDDRVSVVDTTSRSISEAAKDVAAALRTRLDVGTV